MKKILITFFCIISIIQATCFISFAEEIGAAGSTETPQEAETLVIDEPVGADEVVSPPEQSEPQHTVFTRVYEYCTNHKTELLGLVGDAAIFVLAIFVKLFVDKKIKSIIYDLSVVKGDASETATAQTSVVSSVNGMIDGYNQMRASYEKYESVEDDRNRLVGAVMVQNTALLEILTTVYVNNKNLPQGVKDIVNLKYANAQKAIGNDDTLRAIVESVREKIETAEAVEENVVTHAIEDTADGEGVTTEE